MKSLSLYTSYESLNGKKKPLKIQNLYFISLFLIALNIFSDKIVINKQMDKLTQVISWHVKM